MNDEESSLANGMLRIAIRRMTKEHPFHAHLLSPDSLVCNPDVGTMGVTIRGGRIFGRLSRPSSWPRFVPM